MLALQVLVNGARKYQEPGIFVAFEENSQRIIANANSFGWDLPDLQEKKLFFLDAQPNVRLIQSGNFDMEGLLAGLDAKVNEMGAKRIVFDAIDIIMALLDDPKFVRQEIYRLHEWLQNKNMTAIITGKTFPKSGRLALPNLEFMQFMVDCVIDLSHNLIDGISQRSLRVVKYRGSSFEANEAPFVIGHTGLEVAYMRTHDDNIATPFTTERVSSGVARLDSMLDGGYYRGASILLTGTPGTAKTTLCGAFAQAACLRGEATLFVSLDSPKDEMIRNLTSVQIHLGEFVQSGLLHIFSTRTIYDSAEIHLLEIKTRIKKHQARNVVIDPISALSKSGNQNLSHSVVERLINWCKSNGITLLSSSLLDPATPEIESTPIHISTIADTWIHLNYLVHAGERNRSLSIIKSRGTHHSNQVRELVLSDSGITLTDVYAAGGEVLVGSLRYEKEQARQQEQKAREAEIQWQNQKLAFETTKLEMQLEALKRELEYKRAEQAFLNHNADQQVQQQDTEHNALRTLRSADPNNRQESLNNE